MQKLTVKNCIYPLISSELIQYLKDTKFCNKLYKDVNQFISKMYCVVDKIEKPTKKFRHPLCKILLACKDHNFLNTANYEKIDKLYENLVSRNSTKLIRKALKNKNFELKCTQDKDESFSNDNISPRNKLKNLKTSTKKRDLDFDLSIDDVRKLMERKTCYYTGARFNSNRKKYVRTIDRIDNTKGYVRGNVVACTWIANNIKAIVLETTFERSLTITQFKKMANKF